MELEHNIGNTNEVSIMIRQSAVSVKLDETDAAVTSFPGASGLANVSEELGVLKDLDYFLPPKVRESGYSNSTSVFDLMSIPFSGAERIDDLEQLRKDQGLSRLLGRKVMAPSTAHDFLRRIRYDGLDGLAEVRRRLLRRFARKTGLTTATVDCDASLFRSTGRNARMSYKGERGYMPMFSFWEEAGMVLHEDFRNGNTSPGGDALAFLTETLAQLPPEVTKVKVRSDSAWYQAKVMDYCQDEGHDFCFGADRDEAILKNIGAANDEAGWQRINLPKDPADIEPYVREWARETVHTLNDSRHAYRLIVIRKERLQDDLFYGPYSYHVLITNMELSLEDQIAWYRQRGQCENQIKELKWDFETRVLPSGDFFVNAVYLRIMTLAYNLFIAMKALFLPEPYRKLRLKAIRYRLLTIPALVVRHARRIHLKIPRGHPHLPALRQLLN